MKDAPGKLQLITHLSEYVLGDLYTVYNTNTSYVIYLCANFNENTQNTLLPVLQLVVLNEPRHEICNNLTSVDSD